MPRVVVEEVRQGWQMELIKVIEHEVSFPWWRETLPRWQIYSSASVVMTKCHRLGSLNNRNSFSPSAGGCRSKTKVAAGLVFPGASVLDRFGCLLAVSPRGPCAFYLFSFCQS